jgi:hypothetical protein
MTDEKDLLRAKNAECGHRWKEMQPLFPGRTHIKIKNHWKQMEKGSAGVRRPAEPAEHSDPFDQLTSSLTGRGTEISEDPLGGDPFGYGVCWF